jgi:simple sugar transport system substrate-binding protein
MDLTRRDLIRKSALAGAGLAAVSTLMEACAPTAPQAAATAPPAAAAQPTSGSTGEKSLLIYSVTHGFPGDVFWAEYRKGLNDAATRFGVTVKDVAPNTNDLGQLPNLINSAIAAKPNGIIATLPDPKGEAAPLKQAISQGIPVIAINVGQGLQNDIPYLFYVGGDEELAGRKQAEKVLGVKTPKRAACAIHEPGHVGLELRCKGFSDVLATKNVPVDKLDVGTDPTKITEVMRGYFTSHQDAEAVFTVGPIPTLPTLKLLKEMNLTGKVSVVSFDLTNEQMDAIKDGSLLSTAGQQQYLQGYLPVMWFYLNLNYLFKPADDILTGPFIVDKSNVEQVVDLVKQGIW